MAFAGPSEGKQLFVDTVLAQAAIYGLAFSARQNRTSCRGWTQTPKLESDPDFHVARALTAAFEAAAHDADFEHNTRGFFGRAR